MTDDFQTTAVSPPLKLLDFQHHGQALSLVWEWPMHAQQVRFDEVMVFINDVSAWLNQMRYCKMTRTRSASQWMWWLDISSHEIACRVNGQRLLVGQQVRLNHGDEIVLGLTRFLVELDAARPAPQANCDAPESSAKTEETEDFDKFELTELDALMDTTALSVAELGTLDRSAFGDLISLNPEEKVMPMRGVVPLMAVSVQPQAALEAISEPAPEAQKTEKSLDPLDALHAQYLLKLHDPDHVEDRHQLWRDVVRRDQSSDSDPLQDLMDVAGTHPGLDDLLGQSQSIDQVLAGLDTLSHRNVLEPEPFDDVIRLFASGQPRVDVTDMTDSIETLVQRSLPGLTRREHHSMSLDSAMPFFRSAKPSQTES